MNLLAHDPQLRASLSDHGRKWVLEQCSLEKAGARFEAFYSEVLARR